MTVLIDKPAGIPRGYRLFHPSRGAGCARLGLVILAGLLAAAAEGGDRGAGSGTGLDGPTTLVKTGGLTKNLDSWDVSGGGWVTPSNAAKSSANTIRRRPARQAGDEQLEGGEITRSPKPEPTKPGPNGKTVASQSADARFEVVENSAKDSNPVSGETSIAPDPAALAKDPGDDVKPSARDEPKAAAKQSDDSKGGAETAGGKGAKRSESSPVAAGSVKTGEVITGQVAADASPGSKDKKTQKKETGEAVGKGKAAAATSDSKSSVQVAKKGEVLKIPVRPVSTGEVKAKPVAGPVAVESSSPALVDPLAREKKAAKGKELAVEQSEAGKKVTTGKVEAGKKVTAGKVEQSEGGKKVADGKSEAGKKVTTGKAEQSEGGKKVADGKSEAGKKVTAGKAEQSEGGKKVADGKSEAGKKVTTGKGEQSEGGKKVAEGKSEAGKKVATGKGEGDVVKTDLDPRGSGTGNAGDMKVAVKPDSKPAVAKEKEEGATKEPALEKPGKEAGKEAGTLAKESTKVIPKSTPEAEKEKQPELAASGSGASGRRGGGSGAGAEPGIVVLKGDEDLGSVRVVEGGDDTLEPTWQDGYFPTQDDTRYLGGIDYRRSLGNTRRSQGPDNRTQVGVGLFPYDVPGEPSAYDSIYRPINNVLGSFESFGTYTVEGDRLQRFSMTGEGSVPFFTRSFEPDKAHIKAGPVFLDFLYTGAGVLYSDYNGSRVFPEGEEDGWMSFVELAVRGYVRITDQFYIALASRFVYLPEENRLGFALGEGDNLGAFFRANYEFEWDTWDFIIYDEFRGYTFPIFADWNEGEIQRSGRYFFGIPERYNRSRDFFEGDGAYFVNTVGAKASTPFLREDWRLWLEADHRDFWQSYDFDNHSYRDHLGAMVGYEGDNLPFSPYASLDVHSYDRFESVYNTAYIGGRGRLTENLTVNGRVGYLWSMGRESDKDSPLWRLGLIHNLSEDTYHSLWGGQTFDSSDITNETALAQYIRYQISHRFSSRLSGAGFAQLSQSEDLVAGTPETNREGFGGRLDYMLLDFTHLRGMAYYERVSPERVPSFVDKRWIYRAEIEQRVYSRTTARFYYQFEDSEGSQDFDEHLFSFALRRYF